MIFEHLTVGALQTNCYLLGDKKSRRAAVIDPGAEGIRISNKLGELGLDLVAILCTHAHFDHILAAWTLKRQSGGHIYISSKDRPTLLQVIFGLAPRFSPEIRPVSPSDVDHDLAEGDKLMLGEITVEVIETPGHTPGHVAFYLREQGMLFSGDLIFSGSIGRTDFMGGSHEDLMDSVRTKIFILPGDTAIFPGHGNSTSVGREKSQNPFFLLNNR